MENNSYKLFNLQSALNAGRWMLHAILLLCLLATPAILNAQQRISLQDCIREALESNLQIEISRNKAEMTRNNVDYSSFLPTLDATGRQNQTRNDTQTEDASGNVTKNSDVKTDSYSAGVALGWRLFDGLDMFVTHKRYQELEAIGELALQQDVENLIFEVCSLYYAVVAQQIQVKANKYSLELSNERYQDIQFRYEIGRNSRLDARQAIVDLHADSSEYVARQEQLARSYIALNRTMNIDLQERAYVRDSIELTERLLKEQLKAAVLDQNVLLLMAQREQQVSLLDLKKARAAFFPTLDFSTGYNYSKTKTPASSITLNQSDGFYWGFSVNVPIFNKMQTRTRVRNAKLEKENAELSLLDLERELLGDLSLLYTTYENNLLMLDYERESATIAGENLVEAMEKLKMGIISGIEFREFQNSYTHAVDRLATASYQAKMSELSLLQLSGKINRLIVHD